MERVESRSAGKTEDLQEHSHQEHSHSYSRSIPSRSIPTVNSASLKMLFRIKHLADSSSTAEICFSHTAEIWRCAGVGFCSALGDGVVLGQGLSCLDLRTKTEAPSTTSARE